MERAPRHLRVAIAGSGFSGIGAAIRLARAGVRDFLVFERASELGGTWRANTYPGCACDVQSHLYSFSFAPNPNWSRSYSPQPEIWAYLRRCAEESGVTPHFRFDHEIRSAAWDAAGQRWVLETPHGRYTSDILISAIGGLDEPRMPAIPGIDTFAGALFHSARWNHDYDLSGRTVAVIGTGASAIQFVPQIQPKVERLHLFQRTAPWIVPRRDRAFSEGWKRWLARFPPLQRLVRGSIFVQRELFALPFLYPRLGRVGESLALWHMRRQVADPALREKLTPRYRIGCKRVLVSDDYFPSLDKPNVEVVTDNIARIDARGVITTDGQHRPVDAIICGTGFHVTDTSYARIVRGRDGRTLADAWTGSPRAHLGTTVHGFPNFFMLLGPNTALGHSSVVIMIEHQIDHVLGALRHLEANQLATLEPRAEAQSTFIDAVDARMRSTVWLKGGCQSWYLDETGRNSTLWPGYTFSFGRRVRRFDPAEYTCAARAGEAAQIRAA